ncbi:MAG TPA: DUF1176 domain-containing protein [Pyrinomonadaceae bacterium]|jgi:hypothetical protein
MLLHVLAPGVAAQGVPRVKKNAARADRAAWRGVLAWPESCEEAYRDAYREDESYGGLEFHRIGRGRYLVEVVCDGGGIQQGAVFMLYDQSRPRRARALRLKGFEREAEVRALTKFFPRTRELLLMSKADAMGTCGLFVRYSFRGARPRVVEARRQDDCGNPEGTPDASRWPRVRLKE